MNQKRKEIFDKLKLKHPKATDQVVERMMSKMLKISKKDANTVKVEKNRNPSDVKVEDEPDKVAPYQLDDVDAEQASENHIESVQDIDDEMDDDEDHQEKPTKKNGKNEYLDFKKILVHELGPKMRQQIKKIEHDEQNDTEDEADDLKVNVKKEQTKKAKSLQDHAGKAIIEEIHQQIPEFEVDLIEELLKYDDNVVFVGDVPSHLDNRKIMQIFRQFGPIRSVRIRGFTGQKNIEKKLAGIQ